MYWNNIGAEGAKYIAEALKGNSTLLELQYAAAHTLLAPLLSWLHVIMCSLLHKSVSTP